MGKSEVTCDCEVIHTQTVEEARKLMPSENQIKRLAEFYKIFADSTRISILCSLDKRELCVCDLSALLDMSISAVSHQLAVLRESNLVKTRRDGKVVYYSLADEHVQQIIECGTEHISELQ